MDGFFDAYTLIFLILAVVVFLRLRNALGKRTGNERPPYDPFTRTQKDDAAAETAQDNVVQLPRNGQAAPAEPAADSAESRAARLKGVAAPGTPLAEGLEAIMTADPSFEPKGFVAGARQAYEMIVNAFARGDRKTLKPLLSADVMEGFSAALDEREARGEKVDTNFIGTETAEITGAEMEGRDAHVTVRFVSQMITATQDRDGAIVDGDPREVIEVVDVWTFSRDTASRDPNWQLVSTEAVSED
ncbi:MAG: Tim44/TimA family putative adaptor protein [Pseudomonadota bacterium]